MPAWDTLLTNPEIIHEISEKFVQIKEWLKAAHSRQKSYADVRCEPLELKGRDCVLLKVAPWKCIIIFITRGKLNPRYTGPFEIMAMVGLVAYKT